MSDSAQLFDGKVTFLTRYLFWDTFIIAFTSLSIGLPTVTAIYTYIGRVQGFGLAAAIKCYPPPTIGVPTADIEFFCAFHYTLYAVYYPALVTIFGIFILSIFYIWINHYSTTFDLFYSWATQMTDTDPQKNSKFYKKIKVIISNNNCMYAFYIVVKIFQAIFAFIAIGVTLGFITVSPFHQSSPTVYELIYECKVDQFQLLNSSLLSPHDRVLCTALNLNLTVAIPYVNLILLLILFLCIILSIFPKCCLSADSLRLFEEGEDDEAVSFSFCTGFSSYYYHESQVSHRVKIRKNLEFLKVFLFRTNSDLANKMWDIEMLNKLKVLIHKEFMMTISNYDTVMVRNEQGLYTTDIISLYKLVCDCHI